MKLRIIDADYAGVFSCKPNTSKLPELVLVERTSGRLWWHKVEIGYATAYLERYEDYDCDMVYKYIAIPETFISFNTTTK